MKKYLLFLSLLSITIFLNSCKKEFSHENGSTPSEGSLQSDVGGDCLPKTVVGVYEAGTALNPATNYIEVEVNVTTPGSYTIYTDTLNGVYFRATGTFTTTGLITVQLKGNGTPIDAGINNYVVTYDGTQCVIAVTTLPDGAGGPAVFTLQGSPTTCMGFTLSGTYTTGVLLGASNTVDININVTTIGTYNITTVATNGIIFKGTGAVLTTGVQTITLSASGSTPAAPGVTNIPVTAGSTSCSFPVTVVGPATYTVDCSSAVVDGDYTQNQALDATNTVTLDVNVTVIGGYNITGTVNGMTFSGSGSFTATGPQSIVLTGSGTPVAAGTFQVPITFGAGHCDFPVDVDPGTAPGLPWEFTSTAHFSGTTEDAQVSSIMGVSSLLVAGTSSTGSIGLIMTNTGGAISTGTYSGTATSGKLASFTFSDISVSGYIAGLGFGSNLSINLTVYSPATHTVQGTFSGTAKDAISNANVNITLGSFKANLP